MAEERILAIKAAIAGTLGLLTALWGWFGWLVVIWVLLMLADWAAGTALACKNGGWISTKAREGIWHKAGMVMTFLISLASDWLVGLTLEHLPVIHLPFHYSLLLSPLVVVWYIVGELGSLAEHAIATGAPVPTWLLRVLEAGRKAVDAAGEQVSSHSSHQEPPMDRIRKGGHPQHDRGNLESTAGTDRQELDRKK